MGYAGGGRRRSCLELIGAGCVTMVVLVVVAGVVLYYKGGDLIRSGGAAAARIVAQKMFEEFGLPESEREACMVHIRDFSKKIEDGEVSEPQLKAVLEEFVSGPAFAAILARGFEKKYLEASTLSEAERAEGHKTLTRFSQGVSSGEIPREKLDDVKKILVAKQTPGDGPDTYKQKLTDDELRSALSIMKAAADEARVADREFRVNISAEIKQAIVTGMEAGASKQREF